MAALERWVLVAPTRDALFFADFFELDVADLRLLAELHLLVGCFGLFYDFLKLHIVAHAVVVDFAALRLFVAVVVGCCAAERSPDLVLEAEECRQHVDDDADDNDKNEKQEECKKAHFVRNYRLSLFLKNAGCGAFVHRLRSVSDSRM